MLSPRIIDDVVLADEVAADDEGFGKPVGLRLLGIGELEPELRTVAEQTPEKPASRAASK